MSLDAIGKFRALAVLWVSNPSNQPGEVASCMAGGVSVSHVNVVIKKDGRSLRSIMNLNNNNNTGKFIISHYIYRCTAHTCCAPVPVLRMFNEVRTRAQYAETYVSKLFVVGINT